MSNNVFNATSEGKYHYEVLNTDLLRRNRNTGNGTFSIFGANNAIF